MEQEEPRVQFTQNITERDILEFPPEWHDAIRSHLAGIYIDTWENLFKGSHTYGQAYLVRICTTEHSRYLETLADVDGTERVIVNQFPPKLYTNGEFDYDFAIGERRSADLPISKHEADDYNVDDDEPWPICFEYDESRRIGPSREGVSCIDMQFDVHYTYPWQHTRRKKYSHNINIYFSWMCECVDFRSSFTIR